MVEQNDVQHNQEHQGSSSDVHVVVLDGCQYPSPPKRVIITISNGATGDNLRDKIVEQFGYPKESIEVKCGSITIEDNETKTLSELGIQKGKKVIVSLNKRPGVKEAFKTPNMISVDTSSSNSTHVPSPLSSSSSQALVTYGPQNHSSSSTSSNPYTSSYTNSYPSSYSWSQNQGKSSTGYIGLSNQGATCYMNSLIQTLFMTPEFRNGLYNWSFDEKLRNDLLKPQGEKSENGVKPENGVNPSADETANGNGGQKQNNTDVTGLSKEEREKKEKLSIPLQLQRLFARLQLCDVQAVKTKDLTKSFGWEDADAFTQHDVQELCRVLFDALEKNFKGTKQANLVNDLYQGKMKDYVQCKECKHESARVDQYLDIPLVIRGFGETVPVKSVEEALHKFVTPEILDKENQYNCDKCAKKVDAVKGLKIEKFPYLLTLQLKRFDFDFQNMRRIKLNDRVTFPLYLDLNPFILGKSAPSRDGTEPHEQEEEEVDEEDGRDEKRKGKGRDQDDNSYNRIRRDRMQTDIEEDAEPQHREQKGEFDAEPDFDAQPPQVTAEFPYVYELFSVMIHRGSSMGGHYYAYVKSFDTNKWYEFNDSTVSEITVNDVKKAFGGDEEGGYNAMRMYSSYRSNANAYMLMYRQIEPEKNKKPLSAAEVPELLRRVVEDENGAAKQKKKAEELEKEMIKLKIYYNGEDKSISMHKTSTLHETAKASVNLFGLTVAPGCYRLRGYAHYNDLPGDTYSGKENGNLEDLGFSAGYYSVKSLLLEIKESNEEFEEYNSSAMLFRVAKYNPTTLGFDSAVNVYVDKRGTIGDLREAVAQKLGVPVDKQNLYKEPSYSSWNAPVAQIIDKADDEDLKSMHFMEPEKIYVEYSDRPHGFEDSSSDEEDQKDNTREREVDSKKQKEISPVLAALERIKNMIEIKFNLPGKEEFDQKVTVDKNISLKEFKAKIQPAVGMALDDFKIKRGTAPHLYELINESESLSDVSVRDGMSLTIEIGKPLKEGENNYMFEFFDLTKDSDQFTELFEFPLHEDMLISDVKKLLLPRLQEKKIAVSDESHIRLRDVSSSQLSRRIGKVFQDTLTVKKAMLYVHSKRVAVQILDEPETVLNQDKDLCFFVQLFKPSSFELTKKEDFVISDDASLDELREKLGAKFGIEAKNVGILRVDMYYSFNDDPELLEVPEMSWDKPTVSYSTKLTVGDTMMMRSGQLMLCRDNTEKLKELTKEEKDVIKKESNKRKAASNQTSSTYSFWNRKERALKINSEG